MMKRFTAIFLVMLALLALVPTAVFAAPIPIPTPPPTRKDLGIVDVTGNAAYVNGVVTYHFSGQGGQPLGDIIKTFDQNLQPGLEYDVTFKFTNNVTVPTLNQILPMKLFLSTKQLEDQARGFFIPVMGTPGGATDDRGQPYVGQYPPNLVDKLQFKSYAKMATADPFRDGAGNIIIPSPVLPYKENWLAEWGTQLEATVLPNETVYMHYYFTYAGSNNNYVRPNTPGATPGAAPGDPFVRDDNHYQGTHALIGWELAATNLDQVGYIVRYYDVDNLGGPTIRSDRVVNAAQAGLYPYTYFAYTYNASLDSVSGYNYVSNIGKDINGNPVPDNTTTCTIYLDPKYGEYIVVLLYKRGSTQTDPPTSGPTPGRTPVPFIIKYQDEQGNTIRADRTVNWQVFPGDTITYTYNDGVDAVNGYTFLKYIPNPPKIVLKSVAGENVIILVYQTVPASTATPTETIITTPPPVVPPSTVPSETVTGTKPPTSPTMPRTGGTSLTNLFFVGLFLFTVGLIFLKSKKKDKGAPDRQ